MRICRFNDNRLGLVRDEKILDVTAALETLPASRYPFPTHDLLMAALPSLREKIEALAAGAKSFDPAEVRLLSPVANPGKVFAAPVNYMAHLEEAIADPATFSKVHVRKIQETGLFLKATSSLVGASAPVCIRFPDRRTDHEIELAVVIGTPCNNVSAAKALDHVLGYAIGLDITVRGPEERSMRKSIDSYTVLGPWLVTADELRDASALGLKLDVNGSPRQAANTRDLILGIPQLIEFASRFYTLHPGDILLTGTPEGVGPIEPGDVMTATIEKIGTMRVAVEAAAAA